MADRSALVDPSWPAWPSSLAANRALAASWQVTLADQPLAQLRAAARAELLAAAHAHTRAYRDVPPPHAGNAPLWLSGHQPQLFHPGVWLKNFALSAAAKRTAGNAVNLVIDGDTLRTAGIVVPAGSRDEPRVETIPLDAASEVALPFEERTILDRATWQAFPTRVSRALDGLIDHPLLDDFWPLVQRRADAGRPLGAALAEARHRWEGRWGLNTLELPQSALCQLPSFFAFAAHLMCDAPRFGQEHNRALAEYRQVNRIRSARHPVPPLAQIDQWQEVPLWVWTAAAPRRQRLFIRTGPGDWLLGDRAGWQHAIPSPQRTGGIAELAAALAELAGQGVKLRTRALTTTLWSRLALADVFLHGIGGAKYDELTDELARRWLGLQLPAYHVLSATLRLPLAPWDDVFSHAPSLRGRYWELLHHPEHALGAAAADHLPAEVARLLAEKAENVAEIPTPSTARRRCQAIRRINQALQPWLADHRAALAHSEALQSSRQRLARLWGSREFAFCLYPENDLRDFLLEIASPDA